MSTEFGAARATDVADASDLDGAIPVFERPACSSGS